MSTNGIDSFLCTYYNSDIIHISHIYLFLSSCHFSGASSLLDVGSKPTLEELDKLIVGRCSGWEQAALCLGVQSYVLEAVKLDNPNNVDEACRGVIRRWLLHAPGTGETKRSWHSVLEALETSGHSQLTEQLKREHFVDTSEGPISPLSQTVILAGESWDSTTLTSLLFPFEYLLPFGCPESSLAV